MKCIRCSKKDEALVIEATSRDYIMARFSFESGLGSSHG